MSAEEALLLNDPPLVTLTRSPPMVKVPPLSLRSGPSSIRFPPAIWKRFPDVLTVVGSRLTEAELVVLVRVPATSTRAGSGEAVVPSVLF